MKHILHAELSAKLDFFYICVDHIRVTHFQIANKSYLTPYFDVQWRCLNEFEFVNNRLLNQARVLNGALFYILFDPRKKKTRNLGTVSGNKVGKSMYDEGPSSVKF